MKTLRVNDKIYELRYDKITHIFKVERLTKTVAVCNDDVRFRIEYNRPDWITLIGRDSYSNSSYELETPELKEKLYRQLSIDKIKQFKLEDLSLDKIRSIRQILGI